MQHMVWTALSGSWAALTLLLWVFWKPLRREAWWNGSKICCRGEKALLGGADSTTLSAALAVDSTTSIYNFKFCFLIPLGRAPQAPSSCEKTCYMQEDASLRVLHVCAKIPAGSGPPKEAVGEADGDGGGGEEKATVRKKKKKCF